MRLVIQRVKHASVDIDGSRFSEIGLGLLVLVGVMEGDTGQDVEWLVSKTASMRIFNDGDGVMNRSVVDAGGEVLAVSQFTLAASTKKGNRPSYVRAARHVTAIPLYEMFCQKLGEKIGETVKTGIFGADMQVGLVNDGPVTIIIDSVQKE